MKKTIFIINIILIIVFFSLATFQQSYRIGFEQIKIWDEASGAQNAIEMMANSKYIVVYQDGVPDLRDVKPPLALWLKVLSYKIFGINEFAVRFPTLIASWLTMLLFIAFSYRWLKVPAIAWILLILMATTHGYMRYHVARHGDPDALLVFFVSGYFLSFFIVLERIRENFLKYLILTGLFVVAAVYTKSIAGIAPLAGIALYTLITRNGRGLLLKRSFYLTVISAMAAIMSYYVIREALDPGYLRSVFLNELNLFSEYPGTPKHPEKEYYFRYLLEYAYRPWMLLTLLSIIPMIFCKNPVHKRLLIYSLISALVFILGQSASITKNEWYIAPIYPFLWITVAISIYEIILLIIRWNKPLLLRIIIIVAILIYPVYAGVNEYIVIFNDNYIKAGGYVYEAERPGHYLKHLKTINPDLEYVIALTQRQPRQLKFYAKKYHYEDSTRVEIIETINPNLSDKKVFVTDTIDQKPLLNAYHVTLLDSAQYGRLYHVGLIKDSTFLFQSIKQNNEGFHE